MIVLRINATSWHEEKPLFRHVANEVVSYVPNDHQNPFQELISPGFLANTSAIESKSQQAISIYQSKKFVFDTVLHQSTASYRINDAGNDLLLELKALFSAIDMDALIEKQTLANAEQELPAITQALGSLKGRVSDAQAGSEFFYIHPVLGGTVKCRFPDDLRTAVAQADTQMVEVSGLLRYHDGEFLPFEMDVKQINVMPPDSALPTLTSLVGIAPEVTASDSSVEFVRKLRNGWH